MRGPEAFREPQQQATATLEIGRIKNSFTGSSLLTILENLTIPAVPHASGNLGIH
jgi:hypothetical protein